MGERNNRANQAQTQIQSELVQENIIDYDRVSVHTANTNSKNKEEERSGAPGLIEGDEESMTTAELRQRLIVERRREDEERANLTRQNNELREENIRLQEQRSRSTTRVSSKSRTSRSTSRRSQSGRRDVRQESPLDNIAEIISEVDDRYVQQGEEHRAIKGNRGNRRERQGERYRVHHNQDEEDDEEQGRMILHGREMLRNQRKREEEEERNLDAQAYARHERDRRRRRRREEAEEREIQEVVRQNRHDNRVRKARLKRPMQPGADQTMNETILRISRDERNDYHAKRWR
ncbi:trichohyalin-like [Papaver somniferum]|uniref:trichohyalin-like n=1 Tax=Papaver somniferum TaxID=3469 RepID=UPI000E6F53CF|nr:trichohyalin-like [Papaver somniferum]